MNKKKIVKFLISNFVILFILISPLLADNEITTFEGGNHKINFKFYSSALMGIGAHSSNFGNTISSIINDPSLACNNPAGLVFIEKYTTIDIEKASIEYLKKAVDRLEIDGVPLIFPVEKASRKDLIGILKDFEISRIEIPINVRKLSLDYSPSFSVNAGDYYWQLNNMIETQVDNGIEDMKSEDLEPTYPEVDIFGGQIGGLNGFAASFSQTEFGSWGIAFHKPLMLDFELIGNGISVTIKDTSTNSDGNLETTLVPLGIELFSNLNIDFSQVDIGFGRKISDDLSVGIGVNFLDCNIVSNLTAKINGMIRQTGGDIDINVAFNDPNVSYRNTLNDSIEIDFHKNLFGAKLACSYKPNNWLYLDAVYNLPRKANLNGSLRIVQHTLGALNLGYDENAGEELFDMELLKPAELTYTNRTVYESNILELSYPGGIEFSAAAKNGPWKFILSYKKPLGELSFHYECDVYEDGRNKSEDGDFIDYADTTHKSYTLGLKMRHNFKFAVGYGRLAISGQFILADQILEGFKDDNDETVEPMKNIPLGSLAIGFGFRVYKNSFIDLNLIALPSPILRTTLTYEF